MAGEKHNGVGSTSRDAVRLFLFDDFVRTKYLPFVRENKRSWKTDERYLNRHILPYLGACTLEDISEDRLRSWLDLLALSGLSANSRYRIFWVVKYILNCAVRWGDLESDAGFRDVVCPKEKPHRGTDILSPGEALKLVQLLGEYGNRPTAQAIHLLLLTGASKSEILNARWEDVHLNRAVLATNMTYTGHTRLIPLNTEAVKLIRKLPRRRDVPWLFASSSGRRITSLFYTWNLLRQRLGRPELRIQDLRHSFAGFLVNMGVQQNELRTILGHYMPGTLKLIQSEKG